MIQFFGHMKVSNIPMVTGPNSFIILLFYQMCCLPSTYHPSVRTCARTQHTQHTHTTTFPLFTGLYINICSNVVRFENIKITSISRWPLNLNVQYISLGLRKQISVSRGHFQWLNLKSLRLNLIVWGENNQ